MKPPALPYLFAALALAFFAPAFAPAQTPEEKGHTIATTAWEKDNGWGDSTVGMSMTLTNRHGQSSQRQMHNRTMEVPGDGDRLLVVFDEPKDVEGTALLSFSHPDRTDDQWLYLPALKRVKRISSANKSGSFMGSEFAFEDVSSDEVARYAYKFLRTETFAGQEAHVVERDPKDPKSGYSVQHVWWDTEYYRPLKIEYYDRKGDLLKTLTYTDYKLYLDRFWRAHVWHMVNHQNGKETRLVFSSDMKFDNGFTDADFTQAALKRAR